MFKDFKLTFSKEVTSFVQSEYKQAVNILEYGSGGSTILGASNSKIINNHLAVFDINSDIVDSKFLLNHLSFFHNLA